MCPVMAIGCVEWVFENCVWSVITNKEYFRKLKPYNIWPRTSTTDNFFMVFIS